MLAHISVYGFALFLGLLILLSNKRRKRSASEEYIAELRKARALRDAQKALR